MLIGVLIIPSCVELTGQRISWFYDEAKDELLILIHYDGIHDSGSDKNGIGVEQVPKFVENGDVMICDWPWHFKMADLRTQLQDPNTEPPVKDWVRLITSIKTEPVGYYREPDGRIGAAQLVTIPEAKTFMRKFNSLFSREVLEEKSSTDELPPRTMERVRAAAKNGHQWIMLDGHAIRLTLPVHPDEWLRLRGKFLDDGFKALIEEIEKSDVNDVEINEFTNFVRVISSVSFSYIESSDSVTFVLGRSKMPSTLRVKLRDEYEPSLEKVVVEAVKVNLDKALARMLLDKDAEPTAALSTVQRFGPPEEQVRALMFAAKNGNDDEKKAAKERLETWAKEWNRVHGIPKAPQKEDTLENYIAAWENWYWQMRHYPVFAEKYAAAKMTLPQAHPVADLMKAIKNSDIELFKSVFSQRIQQKTETEAWQQTFDSCVKGASKDYGDYNLDDFRYAFSGTGESGEVEIIFKGAKPSNSFEVIKEGGQWKIDEF